MSSAFQVTAAASATGLNQPGTYLNWSIFTVSVANLVLIAVMVVIFGAALILPFPRGRTYPPADLADPASGDPLPQTAPGSVATAPDDASLNARCTSVGVKSASG